MTIEKSEQIEPKDLYLCELLAKQMLRWFDKLIQQQLPIIKIFTGVRADWLQFICQMRDIPVDLVDHVSFMSEVLKIENCIAFAYSMRMIKGTTEQKEVIIIISGQAREYRFYEYEYSLNGLRLTQENSSQNPQNFFQEILPEYYKASSKKDEFINIWQQVRPNLSWENIGTSINQ